MCRILRSVTQRWKRVGGRGYSLYCVSVLASPVLACPVRYLLLAAAGVECVCCCLIPEFSLLCYDLPYILFIQYLSTFPLGSHWCLFFLAPQDCGNFFPSIRCLEVLRTTCLILLCLHLSVESEAQTQRLLFQNATHWLRPLSLIWKLSTLESLWHFSHFTVITLIPVFCRVGKLAGNVVYKSLYVPLVSGFGEWLLTKEL